jgi:hypothetical protein
VAKISVAAGSTSVSLTVFVQASTSVAGLGLTGLAGTSAGLQGWYYRGTGTAVPITLATSSLNAAYTAGLFVEVNSTATGIQGFYRFDPPDAAFTSASGVRSVVMGVGGATNMAPVPIEIELTGWNSLIAVQTSVLAAQVHTGAIIPIVQTASNLGGTVVLAGQVHTNAVIPLVQTASNLSGTVVLAQQVHTAAVIPIVQTASNLGGTVVLAPQTHTAAVIPVVQTASNVVNDVNITGTGMVNIANAIGTTTRPEAYRGSGAAGTPDQFFYELAQGIGQFSITSTGTVASKNVFMADGISSAQRFSLQLDTATQPTGISRA